MKRGKMRSLAAFLSAAIVITNCPLFSVKAETSKGTNGAAVENQICNGTMSETSNGVLSYWDPILGIGCTDNTISQKRDDTIKIDDIVYTVSGRNGAYALVKPESVNYAYEVSNRQLLIGMPNGTYTLTAKISTNISEQLSAGSEAKLFIYADDSKTPMELSLTSTLDSESGKYVFHYVKIPDIQITNGKCKVGYSVKSTGTTAQTAGFLGIDDVVFSAPVGKISGMVKMPDNSGATYAKVSLNKGGTEFASIQVEPGTEGKFIIENAPVGDGYTLTAEYAGYKTVSIPNVSVREGETLFDQNLQFTDTEAIHTYYVDSVNGSDDNTGSSPENAFKTIAKVNSLTLQPGDSILFKAGCSWVGETLKPQGDGTEDAPITIGKYGGSGYPVIHANYVPGTSVSDMTENSKVYALYLDGVEYYVVKDLELTSFGLYNEADNLPTQAGRMGVRIAAKPGNGTVTHSITLDGLYIHDVNGHNEKKGSGPNGQEGAGIHFGNNGEGTYIDGLTIQNCRLEDISRNGITSSGDDGWRPWGWGQYDWGDYQHREPVRHQNVVIKNNILDHISGDGMVPSGTYGAVIEHNLVKYASCNARPAPTNETDKTNLSAAVWPFDTDNSVFQYNEVCYTGTPKNTEVSDGEAFDSDYYCTNTLFQYNYSHDNDGGFLMICGPAYAYNDGTVVRYNISENDGSMSGKRTIFEIGGGGGVDHSYIYNNTIYTGADHSVYSVVRGESWDGKPQGTHFVNNIFCINSNTAKFGFAGDPRDKGKEGIVEYSSNLYCGTLFEDGGPEDMPEDKNAVFGDPKFVNAGAAGDGYENAAVYKIQEGSAAIGKGEVIDQSQLGQKLNTLYEPEKYVKGNQKVTKAEYFYRTDTELYGWKNPNGGHDFFGNAIPENGPVDIGAHQYTTTVTEERKTEVLNELKQYKDSQQYREAQQTELMSILKEAETELASAVYNSQVEKIINAAKTKLDVVKTDEQLSAEEAAWREKEEIQAIRNENQNLKQERDKAKKDLEDLQKVSSSKFSNGDIITIGSVKYRVKDADKKMLEAYGVKNKKLTKLVIEDSIELKDAKYKITSIANSAFSGMKKLKSAVIGKNVTTIGKKAFSKDTKLRTIAVKGKGIKQIGSQAFKGIHKKAVIKVPKSKKNAYIKLFKGKGQKKSVKVRV